MEGQSLCDRACSQDYFSGFSWQLPARRELVTFSLLRKTRRRFPRIEASVPIEVKAECGLVFNATTKDISQIGLLFGTGRNVFQQLTVNQRLSEKSQPVEVDIKLMLPMADNSSVEICTHCRIFQLRRVSSDCYHIGLEYTELSETDYNRLTQYIKNVAVSRKNWKM